jgi:ABC-type histidine transport system ATPase subunit
VGLEEIPETRKAMQVERARILLERVLSEEPKCGDATTLKKQADRLFEEVEVLSSNAAAEQVLARAERLVASLEGTEKVDPAELQATRFLIAALARRLPTEPKVLLLAERAAVLSKNK